MPQDYSFLVDGEQCTGLFFEAEGFEAQGFEAQPDTNTAPCIVMAHGLAAIKEMRLPAYAARFAAAGWNVLVFDYRCFGASDGSPRQWLDIPRQHQDWHAAIDAVKQDPRVDSHRIALWGTSLSGGHVIHVASERSDITAIVSQVPHMDGRASGDEVDFKVLARLLLRAVADKIKSLFGGEPVYIRSSGEPGELAIMTAEGESEGYLRLVPEGMTFDRRLSARFLLQVLNYSPAKSLPGVSVPSLLQVGLEDKTTPPEPAIEAAKSNSKTELICYQAGHFQPYIEPLFDTVVADQIAFLKRVLKTDRQKKRAKA